jgi:hypothetical protein
MTNTKTARTRYDALASKHTSGWANTPSKRHSLGQALLLIALDLDSDALANDCSDSRGTADRARAARSTAARY